MKVTGEGSRCKKPHLTSPRLIVPWLASLGCHAGDGRDHKGLKGEGMGVWGDGGGDGGEEWGIFKLIIRNPVFVYHNERDGSLCAGNSFPPDTASWAINSQRF
jgi:hypothetical protein